MHVRAKRWRSIGEPVSWVSRPKTADTIVSEIDYTYDVLDRRLTKEFESDTNLDITYTYDIGSRMTAADTTDSEIDYVYDNLNRVTETTQRINANNFTVEYQYDDVGNRTKLTYPGGKVVDYTYDDLNRMTHVDVNSSALAEYAYDPLNRRAIKSFLSADLPRTTYEYDLANQLEAQVNMVLASADTVTNQLSAPLSNITSSVAPHTMSSQFTYTHDDVGNRLTMAVSGTLGTTGTHTYTYNDIYELTAVSGADSHSYAYDNVGNRTTVDSVSYTVNSLNEYTQVGSTNFLYDGNDNLANDGTNSYTYDEANRLISASNSSHSASYEYDAFNRRVSKTVDSVTMYYVYDGYEVIEEYNASNVLQADYVMGSRIDEPLTMTRSSTTYYYNLDGLGSIRQLLNSSGTIVESYTYDPYGNTTIYNSSLTDITSTGSGVDNPYMFTGRRFDEETGIYHYRARQYDPTIGRFLQRDPIGYAAGMNLYKYVSNNPLNWIDPSGLIRISPSTKRRFPKSSEYLGKYRPSNRARGGYSRITGASNSYITGGFKPGSGPLVSPASPRQLKKANGMYSNGRIKINTDILSAFEKGAPGSEAWLESTFLHEMTHYFDEEDGVDSPGDEGEQFEEWYFGEDIDSLLDGKYWEETGGPQYCTEEE